MEHILLMTFICQSNEKSSLSISGVKDDLTKDEISSLMDTIIAKNIFTGKNGAFVSKAGAQITARTITKYELA